MKHNRNTKKRSAFTIVELVIVIAVIAILAAVLIPTFSSLITSSKRSADAQLAKNMNTGLAIAEVADGKNSTFHDAVSDIEKCGYTIEKLTPTAEGCFLAWDQKNDRIVFLDENKDVMYAEKTDFAQSDLWMVAHSLEDVTTKYAEYNVYLAGTDAFTDEITVNHGVDAGYNTGITEIKYINNAEGATAQNVIIRTNGGTLTINAPADTVKHYGKIGDVTILAVDKLNSYHEKGEVSGVLDIKSGHLVLESTAVVNSINISAESAEDFTIEQASGSSLEFITVTNPSVVNTEGEDANVKVEKPSSVQSDSTKNKPFYHNEKGYIDKPKTTGTSVLLKDTNISDINMSINAGKTMTIDLNGHTLTYGYLCARDSATINVIDSSTEKTGVINIEGFQLGYFPNGGTVIDGHINFKDVTLIIPVMDILIVVT